MPGFMPVSLQNIMYRCQSKVREVTVSLVFYVIQGRLTSLNFCALPVIFRDNASVFNLCAGRLLY